MTALERMSGTDVPVATAVAPVSLRALSWMLPAADRQSIVGDLLEDAEYRDLGGLGRTVWLTATCVGIAAGLCAEHVRDSAVLPPVREIASGVAIDGRLVWRGDRRGVALRGAAFCAAVAMLAFGVDLLVRALLTASGL